MHRTLLLAAGLGSTSFLAGCDHQSLEPATRAEAAAATTAARYSDWLLATNIEEARPEEGKPGAHPSFNTPSLDGCPFTSRDGKTFYMASNRPDGEGQTDLDIWVSTRASVNDPWGEPVNVGPPVNSPQDDFCPTIDRDGHRFFFVSRREIAGVSCGGSDIYVTRLRGDGTFDPPQNLGCDVNSNADEAGPFPLPEPGTGPVLYFSSTGHGSVGGGDLYVSKSHGGVYGPAVLVPGVNSALDDGQPSLRRDGLELFFYSTRHGGPPDLYAATRASTRDPWSTPVNLGAAVNSGAGDTRPSISWDGTTLYFGSNRGESEAGSADIYVAKRERLHGGSR